MSQVETETGSQMIHIHTGRQMIRWPGATESDGRLLSIIGHLCSRHLYLLDFLFDPDEPKLRRSACELLEEAAVMSSGEDLLVRVALDLWSGSGNAHVWELFEILDEGNFINVLRALMELGPKLPGGWDGPVMRQS
jgi:hypothetical protein